MNPAEKMAQRLEAETIVCSGVMVRRVPTQDDLDASALIRRLAAALSDLYVSSLHARQILQERHADALRDVKEEA